MSEVTTRKRYKHGMANSVEYRIWRAMRSRCENDNQRCFEDYGGRGIKVCKGWREEGGFQSFFKDMGNRPSPEHSIDRENNELGYCCGHCEECLANNWPANCRWITRLEQSHNKRNNRHITVDGVTKTLTEWGRIHGINHRTLSKRLDQGMSFSVAVSTPVKPPPELIEFRGEKKSYTDWARQFGISKHALSMRLNNLGWTLEKALETPVVKRG